MKKMTSLRFDQELLSILKEKAKEDNRSLTNLIETILWSWVRNN